MNTIAVDTSSSTLIAAIKTNTYTEEIYLENSGLMHSESLLPNIIELCKKAGITTRDLELLICTRGPGSFTGLRIAMSALKGIAYGNKGKLVSVSTMLAYANTVKEFDGLVVTAIDAKKQRYYLSAFECKDALVKRLSDDIDGNLVDIEDIVSKYQKVLVIGPDKEAFAQVIREKYNDKEVVTDCVNTISFASSLIELGEIQLKEKGEDDIGQGPVYIRKSDAEIALEEKQKESC